MQSSHSRSSRRNILQSYCAAQERASAMPMKANGASDVSAPNRAELCRANSETSPSR